jgi:DNA-binding NarL/FixJ family response regulator
MSITLQEAGKRVLATTIQAAAACGLVLIGMTATGGLTAAVAVATILGSFAVPVLTAVQRYAQVWLAQR